MMDTQGTIPVMLVERQSLVQAALASLLERIEGVHLVATTGSLKESVHKVIQERPGIVLLSISGEWGTFDAVLQIHEHSPQTKVILLDERVLDTNARESLRVGADGYLTKEQPFHQIENALRRAARGERVYAPEIAARLVLSADGVRLAQDTSGSSISRLTPREVDVLVHLAQGLSVKQCAKALGIGASTAGNHKSRLMKKLDVHKTVDLTRLAMREGLVPHDRTVVHPPHVHDFERQVS